MTIPESPDQSIKYTIPYEWGVLRVTNEADAAYGLIPLTPQATAGDVIADNTANRQTSRVEIRLAGPQELEQQVDSVDDVRHWAGGVILAKIDDKSLNLTIGFVASTDEIVASFEDSSAIEEVKDTVPYILVHELTQEIEVATASLMTIIEDQKSNRRLRRQVWTSGGIAVAATTALATFDFTIGEISPTSAALFGTTVVSQAAIFHNTRRRANNLAADLTRAHFLAGLTLGATAARDVHDSYCRNVFNATYGEEQPY